MFDRFIAVDYTRHTNLCRDFVLVQCMFPRLCTVLRLHVFVGSCFNLYSTVCVCLSLYVCVVQCLLPMQSVRSSPQRVSAALKSLLQETQHATASPVTESCMIGGLQEVLQQFTRLSQNTKQVLYTTVHVHTYSMRPKKLDTSNVTCKVTYAKVIHKSLLVPPKLRSSYLQITIK